LATLGSLPRFSRALIVATAPFALGPVLGEHELRFTQKIVENRCPAQQRLVVGRLVVYRLHHLRDQLVEHAGELGSLVVLIYIKVVIENT
jgi:hypothetical protein